MLVRNAKGTRFELLDLCLLAIILAVAALIRFHLLYQINARIDADEAIVGLMGKHILEGASVPTFYYGQHYMGSFEGLCAAGVFAVLGVSSFALKIVPLIFSLFVVAGVYLLALRFTNRRGAFVAAFLTAVGPSGLILWSSKARGGFMELVAIGTLSLIFAVDALRFFSYRRVRVLLVGLLLGLGWWINSQIIYYCIPIGLYFLFSFVRQERFSEFIRLGVLGISGFFLGSIPFWRANLLEEPRFQTFKELASKGGVGAGVFSGLGGRLQAFFTEALPPLLGARRFWADQDLLPSLSLLTFAVYGAVILALVFIKPSRIASSQSETPGSSPGILVLFLATLAVLFSVTRFGELTKEPRYLLPAYSVLYVLLAVAVERLMATGNNVGRAAGLLIVLLIFSQNMASNFAFGSAVPGEPSVFDGERVSKDHQSLYTWLFAKNYRQIHANYWIGYRVAFETGERVTFSRFGEPREIRIEQYEYQGREEPGYEVYVLVPSEARLVEQGFSQQGLTFRKTIVGDYVILDLVRPMVDWGERINLTSQEVTSSVGAVKIDNLIEQNLGSRWGTGQPQRPGQQIEVVFKEPRVVAGIDIDYGFWIHDAAQELTVEGQRADGSWCSLADTRGSRGLHHVLKFQRNWRFGWVPRELRALRLIQAGKRDIMDWSVAELSVYAPAA